MGSIRYQDWKSKSIKGDGYDYPASIKQRIDLYVQSGNLEYLVDAANCCMLEYEFGTHPNRHFHSEDDHDFHCKINTETKYDGRLTESPNADSQEETR
jgi:hypothetical protein